MFKKLLALSGAIAVAACAQVGITAHRDGLVEYHGAQEEIFETGKAQAKVPLAAMSGSAASYGVGAVAGLDVSRPFPFLLSGTPTQIKWHINVDLSGGKPIDRELFAKSKAGYVARQQPMDIVGFYSDAHVGVFISALAPALTSKDDRNAIHVHMVARDGKSAGHIDDIEMAGGMTLRLPAN